MNFLVRNSNGFSEVHGSIALFLRGPLQGPPLPYRAPKSLRPPLVAGATGSSPAHELPGSLGSPRLAGCGLSAGLLLRLSARFLDWVWAGSGLGFRLELASGFHLPGVSLDSA